MLNKNICRPRPLQKKGSSWQRYIPTHILSNAMLYLWVWLGCPFSCCYSSRPRFGALFGSLACRRSRRCLLELHSIQVFGWIRFSQKHLPDGPVKRVLSIAGPAIESNFLLVWWWRQGDKPVYSLASCRDAIVGVFSVDNFRLRVNLNSFLQ